MNILCTGCAGFIGSNFIHYMLEKYPNYKLVNLDVLTYAGNLENLKSVENNPNYKFVKGDINDIFQLKDQVGDIDVIINFAAESHVDRSIESSQEFIHTNINGTAKLLDYSLGNNIKKFVQVSTDEVYGSLGDTGFFVETTPLAPKSPYSASKTSGDLLVEAYGHTHGLNYNITRCSNNYGPYQFPEKLIPLMLTNCFEGKQLPVYGEGLNVRDWIYVIDHCRGIDAVLHNGKGGEVYNFGGDSEKKNIDIVKHILEATNTDFSMIKYVEDRKGHDWRYAINFTKAKVELGWEPKTNFVDGMTETINWYKDNKNWWEPLKRKVGL